MKSMTEIAPLLLTEEIGVEPGLEKRSEATRLCANRMAQKLKTAVHLVHVEDTSLYPAPTLRLKPMMTRHFKLQKDRLAQLAKSLQVPAKPILLDGDPAQSILSLASKRGAYELIIVGTHGRKGISRLIAGSVAEEVIRNARIPVLIVGPQAQANPEKLMAASKLTLLIPTALTPNSLRAEEYGQKLAKLLGAEIVLFHSLHEALHPVLQTAFSVPTRPTELNSFFEEMKNEAMKKLEKKAATFSKSGIPTSFTLYDKTISASDAVLREAIKVSASLIVMGTHGRSKVSEAFFGRTARDVILGAEVPVITVRSKRT